MMFKPCIPPNDLMLNDIVNTLSGAIDILRQQYQQFLMQNETFKIQHKADQSAVTQADFYVHEYVSKQLHQLSQQYPILSEEGVFDERHTWDSFWLLDPLDGTKEFLAKRPEFTINLSLVEQGKTTFAAIAVPEKQCIYIGYLGQMPFKYHTLDHTWSIYDKHDANTSINIDHISVGVSHRSDSKKMSHFLDKLALIKPLKFVRAGSAYKFCLMLEHQIDVYPRFHPTCEWDTSAGQCLLESIGGGLWSNKHTAFTYNQRETLLNGDFIAFTHMEYAKYAFNAM